MSNYIIKISLTMKLNILEDSIQKIEDKERLRNLLPQRDQNQLKNK